MSRQSSPSMADVARHAGVSPQTVSRVSNNYPGVLKPTRDKVLSAMAELKYRPNSAARALKRGSFKSIGVLLSGLESTGNVHTLNGIVASAAEEGYSLTLMTLGAFSDQALQDAFSRLKESAIDAAILLLEIQGADEIHLKDLPYDHVVIADSNAAGLYPVVDTDQATGARSAMAHLHDLGHRRIQHVTGAENSFASGRRMAAWRSFLLDRGLSVPEPIVGDWTAASGYAAGLQIAHSEEGVTAVFASNDEMALGLMRAFGEHGIRVPEDMSVVGFDDIAIAAQFPTPLTTIHQDFAEVGRRCVAEVLRQIETGIVQPGLELVPTRLVIRESTAPPPDAVAQSDQLTSSITGTPTLQA